MRIIHKNNVDRIPVKNASSYLILIQKAHRLTKLFAKTGYETVASLCNFLPVLF